MPRAFLCVMTLAALVPMTARGAEVTGRVAMPEACATAVSPAVVVLEPATQPRSAPAAGPAAVALEVGQRGLQFEPRVTAMPLGRALRFSNGDTETHNVHVLADGNPFNQSIPPGGLARFVPKRPGVLRLVCDIHSHMRGFVVVAGSPWAATCNREGRFRFRDVPDGTYALKVWHEVGDGLRKERDVEVRGGAAVDVGTITLTGRAVAGLVAAAGPSRRWPEVIDRIGVLLASSLKAAARPDGLPRARALAQDAYFEEFETSGMETAVGQVLGSERVRGLEARFKDFFGPEIAAIAGRSQPPARGVALTRALLLDLSRAATDLENVGVVDASHLHSTSRAASAAPAPGQGDRMAQLKALDRGFAEVQALADRSRADEAASAMVRAYFDDFHPIEWELQARSPGAVVPLEVRFNALRGRIAQAEKGPELASELAALRAEVAGAVARMDGEAAGGFTPAFLASLGIILREGVEVILLLGMLVALVAKAGQPGAMGAIRWGVGLAVAASAVTAVGLNRMLASAQGPAREQMEGLVMLAAAGVLFYVSYWLISQSESRRWRDFLKRQAKHGAEVGGLGTLGLTAFLAVYREGAETALMYQAQAVVFGGSRPGLLGLGVGLGVGLALLAVLYVFLRTATVRLPLQLFFKATGLMLFAMAVVFAGKGVFELQSSGIIRVTPLSWLGRGLPALGLYPNVQTVSVQGLLLAGAALALGLLALGDRPVTKAGAGA